MIGGGGYFNPPKPPPPLHGKGLKGNKPDGDKPWIFLGGLGFG